MGASAKIMDYQLIQSDLDLAMHLVFLENVIKLNFIVKSRMV